MTSYLARISIVARRAQRTGELRRIFTVAAIGVGSVQVPYATPTLQIAVFGILLCAAVASLSARLAAGCIARSRSELRELSRRSARSVYLILYTVLLLQLLRRMLCVSWGGGVSVGWSVSFQAARQDVIMNCGEGFRGYFLCGVIALLLLRGLSAYQNFRSTAVVGRDWGLCGRLLGFDIVARSKK